ncbi:MAG: hypothetical protein HUU21_18740 [Polyangiaceae bacterium]|nr:hypothetical protein [Polyangiaceae bacterium]
MRLALITLLLLAACGPLRDGGDAADEAEPPNAPIDASVRVRSEGSAIHLTAPARRFPKGALFYALGDASPKGRSRIGVLQVADAERLSVKWLCEPPEGATGGLSGAGLLVEPLRADVRPKVGKCWGSYGAQEAEAWDRRPASAIYIPLKLGRRDGVRAWDYYEVLSNPIVADDGRTVVQFNRIALCVVQPVDLSERGSVCRIDAKAWPLFNKEAWSREGVVWLAQEADRELKLSPGSRDSTGSLRR